MDWQSLPSLGALRAFAALAETGSFARAGAALNVSHAAVSQRVRALEETLGVALLHRQGRTAVLTPEAASSPRHLTTPSRTSVARWTT